MSARQPHFASLAPDCIRQTGIANTVEDSIDALPAGDRRLCDLDSGTERSVIGFKDWSLTLSLGTNFSRRANGVSNQHSQQGTLCHGRCGILTASSTPSGLLGLPTTSSSLSSAVILFRPSSCRRGHFPTDSTSTFQDGPRFTRKHLHHYHICNHPSCASPSLHRHLTPQRSHVSCLRYPLRLSET